MMNTRCSLTPEMVAEYLHEYMYSCDPNDYYDASAAAFAHKMSLESYLELIDRLKVSGDTISLPFNLITSKKMSSDLVYGVNLARVAERKPIFKEHEHPVTRAVQAPLVPKFILSPVTDFAFLGRLRQYFSPQVVTEQDVTLLRSKHYYSQFAASE